MNSLSQSVSPIDPSTLPERITVSESGYDNELPLVTAVSETEVLPVNNEFAIKDYSFEISDWNPKMIILYFIFLNCSTNFSILVKTSADGFSMFSFNIQYLPL